MDSVAFTSGDDGRGESTSYFQTRARPSSEPVANTMSLGEKLTVFTINQPSVIRFNVQTHASEEGMEGEGSGKVGTYQNLYDLGGQGQFPWW